MERSSQQNKWRIGQLPKYVRKEVEDGAKKKVPGLAAEVYTGKLANGN